MEFFDNFAGTSKHKKNKKSSNHQKILPQTFFEDLLDREFSLKKNFNMETLKEIIHMYSVRNLYNIY